MKLNQSIVSLETSVATHLPRTPTPHPPTPHLVFRDEGAGVGHHGDEGVEHEDVGEEDEEDEEGDGQPGLGGVVQHLHVGQPQHQLEHGHAGGTQVSEALRERAGCGHEGDVHGHGEGQQLQHDDGGEPGEWRWGKHVKEKRR